eukprot:TRINITY_DN103_c0_g1_i1.p1 TRINITY_DN103_c0_g1~~TRINITY_DN103_c0_g1_i1.p1  ORF type:complete len:302 (+),score=96.49 TRINITY_DN103_c0_g1_i1:54-959(+)
MNQDLDFEKWDVKELKKALERLGIDYSDCIEKKDLVEKLKNQKLHPTSNDVKSETGFKRREYSKRINSVECEILSNHSDPDYLCFIFHGFGANADDLKSLARGYLDNIKDSAKIKFVLPEGLVSLGPQQSAWWPIDQMKLMMAIQTNDFSITEETPFGIDSVREKISSLINTLVEESKQYNPKFSISQNVLLSGFSQGAMLALDLTFFIKEAPLGLSLLSGGIVCKNEWVKSISNGKLNGLQIFQSHGLNDPILPIIIGQSLNSLIKESSAIVTYHEFNGGHSIPSEVLFDLSKFWNNLMK